MTGRRLFLILVLMLGLSGFAQAQTPLIVQLGPLGNIIAGPDFSGETIITAEIDMDDITRAHFDHDVNGHYARPDLFKLIVNEQPRRSVVAVADVVDA